MAWRLINTSYFLNPWCLKRFSGSLADKRQTDVYSVCSRAIYHEVFFSIMGIYMTRFLRRRFFTIENFCPKNYTCKNFIRKFNLFKFSDQIFYIYFPKFADGVYLNLQFPKKSRRAFRDPKLSPRFFGHLKSREDHLGPLKCRGDILLVVLKSRRDYLGTPKNLASTF